MQHPFRFAAGCIAACLVLVLILYAFADKPNDQKNGFNRTLLPQTAILSNSLELPYPAYYIAGYTDQHIYLGNFSASLHLLAVNQNLKDSQRFTLKIPAGDRYAWKLARVMVDSPMVYMAEGNTPTLYQGKLDSLSMHRFLSESCFFNVLQNISSTSFISRSIHVDESGNKQNILAKIKTDAPHVTLGENILTKQVDGIFCTDGTLDYDKQSGKLVYLYHYRNEFITLDTNLHVIYTGHTIDTNSTAKIQVANMSTGINKFSAPPGYVNNRARVADNRIYVLASLLADNDDTQIRQQHEIIDVYSLDNGAYRYTLYLPLKGKERIMDFMVKGNQLFALSERTLSAYTIIKN
ncbi:hypothetical protein [Chitinophaga arvensicola]|uniref:TolB-like 6-blade propeller-like n=1 Tax=Chitinophaga arvensicola TaxID=29529 RepID=A0A1I0S9P3_9BACT|nr:hypothetical protein [Chitinophaga arvensicola]SEW52862.1 hypothetical protein SAMN04488122_5188 [Chitinophaga arvensicola]